MASGSCGITRYRASRVEPFNLSIQGITLVDYGYAMVYQYVLVNDELIFVLGTTDAGKPVLSAISLAEQTSDIVMEFSEELVWSLPDAKLTVFFLDNLAAVPFILIEYASGNLAQQFDETETCLDILRFDGQNGYTLLRHEIIERTNIAFVAHAEAEFRYRYLEVDHSRSGVGTREPAKKDIATIFFCDVSDDGYADILVWKQRYVSREVVDPAEKDFVLAREELSVMTFEKDGLTFSALKPLHLGEGKHLSELPFFNQ